MYDLFSQLAEITKPAFMPAPAQPEEQGPAPAPKRIFTNVPDLIKEVQKIGHAEEMNYQEFTGLYTDIKEQTPAIFQLINKMTIADINKYVYKHSSSDSKKDMVSRLFDSLIGSFNLSDSISYSPFGGSGPQTYAEALELKLNAQKEQDYINYCTVAQAKRDAKKKALTNPETLEEFRVFLQYRKPDAMTTEQRYLYDTLITEGKQERREQEKEYKAEVKAVQLEGLHMEIKTSHHAKKNIPLWVITLSDRVEGNVFTELKEKARKFDGYYSSYRGQGEIPGFIFESEENAGLFSGLQDGNVSNLEVIQKTEEQRTQDRAVSLEDKANGIKERAEESLNRDRKDNTHRRARMAASAENAALYNIEFAETMQKIAAGQADGTIKFLNRLATIKDLETLNMLLSQSKMRYIKAKGIKYEDYELCMEVVDFVRFPFPSLWKTDALSDCMKLQNTAGCKLAAARMIKRLMAFKEDSFYVTTVQGLEDFETLFCTHHRNVPTFYGNVERHKGQLLEYKRVMRMQLESLPELRTALRELVNIKLNTTVSPEMKRAQEVKELERKFIGQKIDGFFPTPRILAEKIVNLAKIEPGNTILEPSAGLGHLAEVIEELHPENSLTVCEISYSLCEALKLKGYQVAEREDFLQHTSKYDRIVMNPPFENGQDMEHVLHAYSLLNAGGRLVAIMAGNKSKTNKKTAEFMEFAQNNGYTIDNPSGSFLSAFRPTGVNTITVVIDKS